MTVRTPRDAVELLNRACGSFPIHNIGLDPENGDTDIFCPAPSLKKAEEELAGMGFTVWHDELGRLQAERFFDGKLTNLHLYEKEGFSFYLGTDMTEGYLSTLKSPEDFASLPYLTFRTLSFFKQKYLPTLEKRREELERESFFVRFLEKDPFTRKITFKDFDGMVRKRLFAMLSALGPSRTIHVYSQMLSLKLRHLGKGRVITVLGVDGVGKTTLVAKVCGATGAKRIYMGNNGFLLQPLHGLLGRLGRISIPFTFLLAWLEQLLRCVDAALSSSLGATVILERHPKYEIQAYAPGLARSFGNLFYGALFPDAREAVVIWCDEKMILERKDEGMGLEALRASQYALLDMAKKRKKPTVFIENVGLDDSLNRLLSVVRQRAVK